MPNNVWTINAATTTTPPGGTEGADLVGCHITENDAGTAYEFTEPNINNVLSTTTGTTLPTGAFDFPAFDYDGVDNWNVHVTSLTTTPATGSWSAGGDSPKDTDPESGTWTAQAGGGAGEDDPKIATSTSA